MEKALFEETKEFKNQYLLEDRDYNLDGIIHRSKNRKPSNKFSSNFQQGSQPIKDKINYYFLVTFVIISILAVTVIDNSRIKIAVLLPFFLSILIYSLSFFGIDIRKHFHKRYYMRLSK
jgi:hypothetical protein